MALIFEPFANSKLVFGCAQELWDLLGMLLALDISMLSLHLSAGRNRSRMMVLWESSHSRRIRPVVLSTGVAIGQYSLWSDLWRKGNNLQR